MKAEVCPETRRPHNQKNSKWRSELKSVLLTKTSFRSMGMDISCPKTRCGRDSTISLNLINGLLDEEYDSESHYYTEYPAAAIHNGR